MKATALLAILMLVAPALAARASSFDDHHVEADEKTDFSALKTFTIREGTASSRKPEINNKLTLRTIEDAIRKDLLAKGLKETQDRPDLVVAFSIGEEGRRGVAGRGIRNMRVTHDSEGTLVVDMTNRTTNSLVWQGVYLDKESNAAKLAKRLPDDVKKLLKEFPPKKKK